MKGPRFESQDDQGKAISRTRACRSLAPALGRIVGLSVVLFVLVACVTADNSSMFTQLKTQSDRHGAGIYTLSLPAAGDCDVPCSISKLRRDHFSLEIDTSIDSSWVSCGEYTLPENTLFILIRRGTWLVDSYSYYVRITVDEHCRMLSATGEAAGVIWF